MPITLKVLRRQNFIIPVRHEAMRHIYLFPRKWTWIFSIRYKDQLIVISQPPLRLHGGSFPSASSGLVWAECSPLVSPGARTVEECIRSSAQVAFAWEAIIEQLLGIISFYRSGGPSINRRIYWDNLLVSSNHILQNQVHKLSIYLCKEKI